MDQDKLSSFDICWELLSLRWCENRLKPAMAEQQRARRKPKFHLIFMKEQAAHAAFITRHIGVCGWVWVLWFCNHPSFVVSKCIFFIVTYHNTPLSSHGSLNLAAHIWRKLVEGETEAVLQRTSQQELSTSGVSEHEFTSSHWSQLSEFYAYEKLSLSFKLADLHELSTWIFWKWETPPLTVTDQYVLQFRI